MPSVVDHQTRPRFTLPAASDLRDRAGRVGGQVNRTGRPRRRYLHEQRVKLARRLLPTFATFAAVSGVSAIIDFVLRDPPLSRMATLGQALVTIFLGAGALATPIARGSLVALRTLATAGTIVLVIGWSIVAHYAGAGASEYVLAAPLCQIAAIALLAIPPRAAIAVGVVGYLSLLVCARNAAPSVHLLVLAIGGSGYVVERARHRRNIIVFMRIERLSSAVARIRRMQEQLVVVEKLEALRVLVGGMAHELNNALTVAQASAAQAQKAIETNPAQVAPAMKRAEGGLTRIRRTVDRLRRFAMAAEGTLEPADVAAMLDFALESAVGRARSGVIIERAYDQEVGAIECHVAALAEAMFQVARNAVEAMPGGGTINAKVRREGERIVVTVADEGRGIPPDQLAKVFDPFYQGKPDAGKSGLGLSAVYGLVSALGGTVHIKSDVGKGTEVAISMPAKRVRPSAPPPSVRPLPL